MEGRAELGDNKETQPKIVWTRRKKATIASLCMVLFVALASFSIISPFFPNEVRLTSTRSVGFQALKIICVLVASIIRPAGVLKVPERTCIRKWKNNMGRAKRKGTLWHILPILSYWYFRIIGQLVLIRNRTICKNSPPKGPKITDRIWFSNDRRHFVDIWARFNTKITRLISSDLPIRFLKEFYIADENFFVAETKVIVF